MRGTSRRKQRPTRARVGGTLKRWEGTGVVNTSSILTSNTLAIRKATSATGRTCQPRWR